MLKKAVVISLMVALPFVVGAQEAATVASVVEQTKTDMLTNVTLIGTLLLSVAGVCVMFKWLKGSLFS